MIRLCCEYLSVWCNLLYLIIVSRTRFRLNPYSIVCLNVKELFAQGIHTIWKLSGRNEIRIHQHLVRNRTLTHLTKPAKSFSCILITYLYGAFDYIIIMSRRSFRVNPHSTVCLNVKELLARSRCDMGSLGAMRLEPTTT